MTRAADGAASAENAMTAENAVTAETAETAMTREASRSRENADVAQGPSQRMPRRTLLLGAGAISIGGAAATAVGPGLGAAEAAAVPLTAEGLRALRGQWVTARWAGGEGPARVGAVTGHGRAKARSRQFQVILQGPGDLPPAGEIVTISHPSLGRHDLFAVPDRDARRWVIVVNDAPAGVDLAQAPRRRTPGAPDGR